MYPVYFIVFKNRDWLVFLDIFTHHPNSSDLFSFENQKRLLFDKLLLAQMTERESERERSGRRCRESCGFWCKGHSD